MAKVGNIELRVNTEFKQKYPLFYTSSKKFEVKGIADEFYKITGIRSCGECRVTIIRRKCGVIVIICCGQRKVIRCGQRSAIRERKC